MKKNALHFSAKVPPVTRTRRTACGVQRPAADITPVSRDTTCGNCRRTKAWKLALTRTWQGAPV